MIVVDVVDMRTHALNTLSRYCIAEARIFIAYSKERVLQENVSILATCFKKYWPILKLGIVYCKFNTKYPTSTP
jgi:hypothetical protein